MELRITSCVQYDVHAVAVQRLRHRDRMLERPAPALEFDEMHSHYRSMPLE